MGGGIKGILNAKWFIILKDSKSWFLEGTDVVRCSLESVNN